jgi:3-deoxy-manno-octulosonate cytidylyltransferase (CMP-KDO synthetase)
MNRVLETGGKIRMVLSNENTIGVDVPGELKIAEDIMISDKVFKKYMKHEGK